MSSFANYAMWLLTLMFTCKALFSQDVFDAARNGDTLRVKVLMNIHPDTIQKANKDGFSPLILACYRNQSTMAEFLLKHKANINFVSPEGTALMATIYKNEYELAKQLLLQKANPDLCNDLGTTALMLAVSGNQKEMVELLIEFNCNKDLKDKEGRSALQIARAMKNIEMIDLLGK